jgi:hypothetical protein
MAGTTTLNCWEFTNCGREAGGRQVGELGICPAYPTHGHSCARVAGTFCGGQVMGTFALKLTTCTRCEFYRSQHYVTQAPVSGPR